jgi:ABC-type amino acid transport substrate-binding protein
MNFKAAVISTLAAVPLTLALGGLAFAQSDFAAMLGEPKAIKIYPNPWPLKNLVTPGTLTVGTTGASPPRTFVDASSGELKGSYVELFKKLAADLGLQIQFVQLEWAGILPGLAAHRFDLACDGASWNAERLGSDQFLMTSPTSVNATVALTMKDSGIKTFDDAATRNLGGVRGEIYFEGARKALPNAPATEFPGLTESLLGLQNGQVDLSAMNLSSAINVLKTAPNKDDLQLVGPALEVFAQGLCVAPNEPDLLVAINTLLGNYRADGTLKALLEQYDIDTTEVDMLSRIGY